MNTLDFDTMSLFLGLGVGLVAAIIGYGMRKVSHAILPIRDPFFIFVMIAEFVAVIMGSIAVSDKTSFEFMSFFVSDLAMFLVIAFDMGYLIGYIMCRPNDTIYVDLLESETMGSNTLPLVHYVKEGVRYMMPQTFGAICKSFLGVRYPLNANLHAVANFRTVAVTNGIIKLNVSAAPTCLHNVEELSIGKCKIGSKKTKDENGNVIAKEPRYLFHFYAESHTILFSQETIDDPQSFWRKAHIYIDAVQSAAEAREQVKRLEIQQPIIKYQGAEEMVTGLISLTNDAPNMINDLLIKMDEEVQRRENINALRNVRTEVKQ